MNKQRRKRIADIVDELSVILDKEDEYRDNMPENLQGSLAYETSEEASDHLQEAIDTLNEID